MPAGSTAVNAVRSSLNHVSGIGAAAPKVTPLLPRSTPVERPIVSVDLPPTTAVTTAATTTTGAAATHQLEDSVESHATTSEEAVPLARAVDQQQGGRRVLGGRTLGSLGQPRAEDAVEIGIAGHAGRSTGTCSRESASMAARSALRAPWSRDFTVPTEMPSDAAISATDRSS